MISATACLTSFILAGVCFSFADFSDIENNFKNGKYQFNKSFSMNTSINGEADWVEKDFTFSTESLQEIVIESKAAEVIIEVGENADQLFLNAKTKEEDFEDIFSVEVKDGVLYISNREDKDEPASFFGNNESRGAKLKIKVPSSLVAAYRINVDFGDVSIKGVSGESLEFELAAGDVEVQNINFKKFSLKAAAGDIDLINTTLEEGVIEAAAGDINLKKVISKGEFVIQASAGNISVEMNQEKPFVKISASAGDIEFSLSEGHEYNFTIEKSTTVGNFNLKTGSVEKEGAHVYGKGEGLVEIETTFGNVEIK